MIIGRCFICLFAVLIHKVSLQVTVKAVIGGSVVLPCSTTERDLKLQEIDVFWKDKDDETLYNVIKGTDSLDTQDPRYKGRAKSFQKEYERGNFSIKLNNLSHADAGAFICYITPLDEQKTVELIIHESTEQENHGQQTQLYWWQILLICVFILVFLIILGLVYFKFRKRIRSPAPI